MKLLSIVFLTYSAAAYRMVPADGIYLYIPNFDEAAQHDIKIQEATQKAT